MRKLITVLMLALALGTLESQACKRDKEAEAALAKKIAEMVNAGDFTIWVTSIHPANGPVKNTLREYWITVKDGKANGRLPFIGTSYVPVLGSDDPSIVLEDTPVEISVKSKARKRKDEYCVKFSTAFPSSWKGEITIWDNGSTSIRCISNNTSSMSYYGELEISEQQ